MDTSISSSVLWASGISSGVMPQDSASCRCTCGRMTKAMMGCSGRYLLSRRAVLPDSETVTMAEALTSCAVRQAAWAVASLTEVVPSIFIRLSRWLW